MCCIHVCNVDTVYNVFLLKKKIIQAEIGSHEKIFQPLTSFLDIKRIITICSYTGIPETFLCAWGTTPHMTCKGYRLWVMLDMQVQSVDGVYYVETPAWEVAVTPAMDLPHMPWISLALSHHPTVWLAPIIIISCGLTFYFFISICIVCGLVTHSHFQISLGSGGDISYMDQYFIYFLLNKVQLHVRFRALRSMAPYIY